MDHLIFKDVNCVVLVYSITSALSFHMIEDRVHQVIDFLYGQEYMLVLVANKSDLQDERAVPKDYGLQKL